MGLRPAVDAANVRFGSKADIGACLRNVRFTPKSGHQSHASPCVLWAISGPRVSMLAPILRATLSAHRHAVPHVAMQTPPAIRASAPDHKVFCLCLPGVGFANLVSYVAGDLKLSGLECE